MNMAHGKYVAVPQDELLHDEEKDEDIVPTLRTVSRRRYLAWVTLCGLLLISLALNLYSWHQHVRPWDLAAELPSRYANLRRNVVTKINYWDDFQSVDRAVQEAAWDRGDLNPREHVLALDEDVSVQMGLPHSQRWPWDHNKGVYLTVAAHDLNCLRAIRENINENFDRVPLEKQTWSYEHITHCINVLRVSIACNADDQPMYMGHLHDNINKSEPRAGFGQIRICRDWGALVVWNRANSACFYPTDLFNRSYPEVERYKFCPDGARPWENIDVSSLPGRFGRQQEDVWSAMWK